MDALGAPQSIIPLGTPNTPKRLRYGRFGGPTKYNSP